eukprot:COSAG01_NODE_44817_length_415_cov_0.962025_1_plen_86_part_01
MLHGAFDQQRAAITVLAVCLSPTAMRTALCGLAGAFAVAQPLPEQQWPLSTKGRTLSWPGTAVIDSYQQQQKCIWSTYKQCNRTGY